MLEIALLLNPIAPTENPGLDTLDPRFQEIAGLVESGEFAKASEQTQALLKEGIADIRVISYFLYGVFLESGLLGLPQLLQALAGLFSTNWASVGPTQKKEKHAENGVGWFLGRLTKKLKAEEEAKSEEWNKWVEEVPAASVPPILEKIAEVRTAMAVASSQKLADALKGFEDWIKDFPKIADAEAKKLADAAAADAPPPEAPVEAAADGSKPATPSSGAPSAEGAFMVEGSVHLRELARKIAAFETLVRKKQYARASVVYNDVTSIMERFDPRVYIPKMLASFYSLSMNNLDSLLPDLEKKETPSWKAMEQLYRVDVDIFTK
jgi:hypothetical protein